MIPGDWSWVWDWDWHGSVLASPVACGRKNNTRGFDMSGHVQQAVATHGRSPQTDRHPDRRRTMHWRGDEHCTTSSSRPVAAYKVV